MYDGLPILDLPKTDIISITIETGCYNCPTYSEINSVFPDTTNYDISGKFVNNIRGPPIIENDHLWYAQYGYANLLWLDHTFTIIKQSKTITIVSELESYKLFDSNKMIDGKITFGKDRFIHSNCANATVSKDNWLLYLGDTIHMLKNNCEINSWLPDTYTIPPEPGYYEKTKYFDDLNNLFMKTFDKWKHNIPCLGEC